MSNEERADELADELAEYHFLGEVSRDILSAVLRSGVSLGAERVSGARSERVSGAHPVLEDGRSGQERQPGLMPTFDPSWISSTRESDSSRHSFRKCGSGG